MKVIVWKDGSYKEVEDSHAGEYEQDKDWLATIPLERYIKVVKVE